MLAYHWRFPHTSSSSEKTPLDLVEVAASVNMNELAIILDKHYPTAAAAIRGEGIVWKYHNTPTPERQIAFRYLESVQLLHQWGILRQSRIITQRFYASYFEVPKKDGSSRAILNCKALNANFSENVSFRLGQLEQAFRAMAYFATPNCGVADLRHWFHQLSLPVDRRHLFSLAVKDQVYESVTWPMGFKHSPFVAQSSCCALLLETLRGLELEVDPSPNTPHRHITARSAKTGRILLFAMVWYDNILLIAGKESVIRLVTTKFSKLCSRLRVVIKDPGFAFSVDKVEFLGVTIVRRGTEVRWRHIVDNINIWKGLCHWPVPFSGQEVAKRLGVLNWHIQVTGGNWSPWRDILQKAQVVMKPCLQGVTSWKEECWSDSAMCEPILAALSEVCADVERCRPLRPHLVTATLIAADASNSGGGCALIDESGIREHLSWTWSEAQTALHINQKEMRAAVIGVEKWGLGSTVIFVDNTVAECWLNDPESLEEYELHLGRTTYLESHRVSSADNPADGLSRGKAPTQEDNEKARALVSKWKNRPRPWYETTLPGTSRRRAREA